MTATAKVITKTKKYENRDRENLNGDLQMELDRALADSFPASDPPSITQPGCLKRSRTQASQSEISQEQITPKRLYCRLQPHFSRVWWGLALQFH
jgi:hypothetical protein